MSEWCSWLTSALSQLKVEDESVTLVFPCSGGHPVSVAQCEWMLFSRAASSSCVLLSECSVVLVWVLGWGFLVGGFSLFFWWVLVLLFWGVLFVLAVVSCRNFSFLVQEKK